MNDKKQQKSRRTFLQSLGLSIAGFGLFKPSLVLGNRNIKREIIQPESILIPVNDENYSVKLPQGVRAVWDMTKAFHNSTSTRENICLNGLWLWQPEGNNSGQPPQSNWGYFKVPGPWPRVSKYGQKDSQTIYSHPAWKDSSPTDVTTAWYQREIAIPAEWTGRRILLSIEYLNSYAALYVDGKKVSDLKFPSGMADLTHICRAGNKHIISLQVTALPLQSVLLSFSDTNNATRIKGSVARRGLCGDVFLMGIPLGPCINEIKVNTSFRKEELSIITSLQNLSSSSRYLLHAEVIDKEQKVFEFTSKSFSVNDLDNGRIKITEKWKAEKLWDTHTPENQYKLNVSLLDSENMILDKAFVVRFGYREFWIDGRDFYLNGTRIFLSALPIDNAQSQVALATYESIKETMLRLQSVGINFVFTHNYGCQPGTHLSFTELLRAADDTGMLISFSQPHFGHYDWKAQDADEKNGYAAHAEFYVRMAQNHPSVVFYSTSHNSTGYGEDMNPDLIDGLVNRDQWNGNNARLASRAEAILKRLDPEMIVYHHSSGNLGSMHTSNFYTNWAPVQEKSDWLEHWSTKGVKPFFTCEYSDPSSWDWTMYRGWYKGERAFGGANVPWEFCIAEWNSQLLGDLAFRISDEEKKNLRWEAAQFRAGKVWGRFEYPYHLDYKLPERYPVYALSIADRLRAARTWEISAHSEWEFSNFFRLRKGLSLGYKDLSVDWDNLQRPGFSPDGIDLNNTKMESFFERTDWIPSVASEAFTKNNMPLLGYIAGKSSRFTSKDHNYLAGESFEKQIIIINNCRQTVSCECKWSLNLPQAQIGNANATIATGQQTRIPISFDLPPTLAIGKYELKAEFQFSNGEKQSDSFFIHVLPGVSVIKQDKKVALWDPAGETAKLIGNLGIKFHQVEAGADLSGFDLLIVGKAALTSEGPGLNLDNVRKGLKVIVFEQKSEVLENRFGFRVQEYGLRNVFRRLNDHPLLLGLNEENLRDWRGEATILPPRLKYELSKHFGTPTINWCGIPVPRQWRCGTQGNVASVLIEKPARGNFVPVIDGGFSLQYSPLMEYREGRGMVLFCQMDVTGRTEYEPATERLTYNIISYVSGWKPDTVRKALYLGEKAGIDHLGKANIPASLYDGGELSPDQVLIAGPGSESQLSSNAAYIKKWLKEGGHLMAVGLNENETSVFMPSLKMKRDEHIATFFEPFFMKSPIAGIGPADVHNRAPKEFWLVSEGAKVIGNGVLAYTEEPNIVFCQLVPWHMDYSNEQHNVKQTFRHTSFLLSRLLGNMGVAGSSKLLSRFNTPVENSKEEKRWLDDLYLDLPEEWDDPYRFFRW